jgi:hypothetical protein
MITCPQCNNRYQRVGQHFALSECGYPKISDETTELLIGLLIGDGFIQKTSKNATLIIRMTNKKYLEWVDKITDNWLTTDSGVYLDRTAEESFELTKSISDPTSVDNHRNYWGLKFTKHELFTELRDKWYDGSEKVGPDNITLTSEQIKHWFVADGNLHIRKEGEGRPQLNIYANGLVRNGWDQSIFRNCPVTPRVDDGGFKFNADEAEELLRWIGDPVPGFEYKWETNREKYFNKKKSVYNQKI